MRNVAVFAFLAVLGGLAGWPWASALLDSGGPANRRFVMQTLNASLSEQYHLCVPLGWNPEPVDGYYYPAHSVEYRENGVWLHPYWLGLVHRNKLSDPNVRLTVAVLNALVRAKLVDRALRPQGYLYRVTMAAAPYYFENNSFGNNPDHLPYLCYSRLIPQRVVLSREVRGGAYRVEFVWQSGPNAPWSSDPFLRAHSVILPPVASPSSALFSRRHGNWAIERLTTGDAMLPRPVDAAAWTITDGEPR